MNPIGPFLAYIARKRASRALRIAERQRQAIIAQIAERRAHKREWKPLGGLLRQATEASLKASVGRR